MNVPQKPADPRHEQRETARRLESLRDESHILSSSLAAAGRRAARHFAGENANETPGTVDLIELWGRRIGRGLSLVAFIGLAIYLYLTYVR